jgi:hypothetical protein
MDELFLILGNGFGNGFGNGLGNGFGNGLGMVWGTVWGMILGNGATQLAHKLENFSERLYLNLTKLT